mmetsp:Transcript_14503/g.27286  ORF Transcript_14503/g.27286 Transcript_14503/m.27286 type:complete len:278 (-) Transcript_14503:61-894(-)
MGNINSILFRPPEPNLLHPSCRFFLKTSQGNRISACYFKRVKSKITLIYSHANAEDLGIMFIWLKCLARRLDVNILAYDYTGYGESDGEPSEEACYADIEAAYDYLIYERKLDPRQIVLYGRSVGSGPATYLASKLSIEGVPLGGLILECPFKSVYRVVADFGCTVLGDKFPNIDRISSVRCPTLIIHGTDDRTIPFEHGIGLYDALPIDVRAKPYWVIGKGHNNIDYNSDQLIDSLSAFLEQHVPLYRRKRSLSSGSQHKLSTKVESSSALYVAEG